MTKSCFRMLNTLYNLGPAPEPNLTVLWSAHLPENWKRFTAKVSCDTDALQYENDDVMRPVYGDDYAIACCVSAMHVTLDRVFSAPGPTWPNWCCWPSTAAGTS